MPGCCVPGCSKHSSPTCRLFRFPADKGRRLDWEIRIKRENWKAKDSSRICQEHFKPSQFEEDHRLSGHRILKKNAKPTIFPTWPIPIIKRTPPAERRGGRPEVFQRQLAPKPEDHSVKAKRDHSYTKHKSDSSSGAPNNVPEPMQSDFNGDVLTEDSCSSSDDSVPVDPSESRLPELHLQTRLHHVTEEKQRLEQSLRKFLNDDQIEFLEKGAQPWSIDTLRESLQLRLACGTRGYGVLLARGYPLPSVRTLNRRLGDINASSSAGAELNDIITLLNPEKKSNLEELCNGKKKKKKVPDFVEVVVEPDVNSGT